LNPPGNSSVLNTGDNHGIIIIAKRITEIESIKYCFNVKTLQNYEAELLLAQKNLSQRKQDKNKFFSIHVLY